MSKSGNSAQSCSIDLFVTMMHSFFNPLYIAACALPLVLPLTIPLQFVSHFLILVDVVPVMIIETVCLCRECYRHRGRLVLAAIPVQANTIPCAYYYNIFLHHNYETCTQHIDNITYVVEITDSTPIAQNYQQTTRDL